MDLQGGQRGGALGVLSGLPGASCLQGVCLRCSLYSPPGWAGGTTAARRGVCAPCYYSAQRPAFLGPLPLPLPLPLVGFLGFLGPCRRGGERCEPGGRRTTRQRARCGGSARRPASSACLPAPPAHRPPAQPCPPCRRRPPRRSCLSCRRRLRRPRGHRCKSRPASRPAGGRTKTHGRVGWGREA